MANLPTPYKDRAIGWLQSCRSCHATALQTLAECQWGTGIWSLTDAEIVTIRSRHQTTKDRQSRTAATIEELRYKRSDEDFMTDARLVARLLERIKEAKWSIDDHAGFLHQQLDRVAQEHREIVAEQLRATKGQEPFYATIKKNVTGWMRALEPRPDPLGLEAVS